MKPFSDPAVAQVFEAYPPVLREKLLTLRELIFDTAASTDGVGELEETLKWGEHDPHRCKEKAALAVRDVLQLPDRPDLHLPHALSLRVHV